MIDICIPIAHDILQQRRKKNKNQVGYYGRYTPELKVRRQLPQGSGLRCRRRSGVERGGRVVATSTIIEVFWSLRKSCIGC